MHKMRMLDKAGNGDFSVCLKLVSRAGVGLLFNTVLHLFTDVALLYGVAEPLGD